jgi:hypothetical protein
MTDHGMARQGKVGVVLILPPCLARLAGVAGSDWVIDVVTVGFFGIAVAPAGVGCERTSCPPCSCYGRASRRASRG